MGGSALNIAGLVSGKNIGTVILVWSVSTSYSNRSKWKEYLMSSGDT